ncbi:MAG: argininosuccinate synthase [Micavibrio aeruginosavorus]|uniref:Argininosuccinate synthase n=1 Tax=Micavibrio aeruginosavorus TaxID=349221 RepID=A0A2W5N392_9BACT|nr:MAG: argininosuccinate synthase [Micavibrio aeruginosavorus]
MNAKENKKVVLAYSGGLDTSVILKWLIEEEYEVICFMADVGQKEDMEAAKTKALGIGASKIYIEDLKKELITDYIFPAYAAGAIYERRYLLGTSLARPLTAKKQIEIAQKEGAAYVAHGCTGKGNDQVRFELTYYALQPDIKVISPWKTPEFLARFRGRSDMIQYSEQHGIPIKASRSKPYSEDENLLHISHEAGILEDPSAITEESVYSHTAPLSQTPDKSDFVKIDFEKGIPVKVADIESGKSASDPLAMFELLNEMGYKHSIGRLDMVENRFVGIKSRGVYETPGGQILYNAHTDLESITLDREVLHLKHMLADKLAVLIYNGFWFSPEKEMIMAAMNHSQKTVTGSVTVQLFKGSAYPVSRTSPLSLYNPEMSSMDVAGGYDQQDAGGFIKINAIRLKAATAVKQQLEKTGGKNVKAA